MAKQPLVGREAVVLQRSVQIGNSWFNAGEIHVFGRQTAQLLYDRGDARPHTSSSRKHTPPPAPLEDKQIVAATKPASENRQLASRPRISRRANTKESLK